VRAAEQELIAANAGVGVARAAFLPHAEPHGTPRRRQPEPQRPLRGRAHLVHRRGPPRTLFAGGSLIAQERVARAQFDAARATYEQTFTRALGEVSTDLVAIEKLAVEETERTRAVNASRDSVRLATRRYESGFSAYFEVLDALQQLLPAEPLSS